MTQVSDNTILVAIPFVSSPAQGRELEFAIAGWKKHFKENDYILVVIGDRSSVIDCYDDVLFIDCPRIADDGTEYRNAMDVVHKFKKLYSMFPNHKGCVWAADDIYAVNDFDIADIKFLKMLEPELSFQENSSNPWRRMMFRTTQLLKSEGLPTKNFSVHLPCWYDFDKLLHVIEKYDLEHRSYNFQTIYFNTYFGDRLPFQLNAECDNIKYGIYDRNQSIEEIKDAMRKKIWINNSNRGYSNKLETLLSIYFEV